MNRTTAQIDPSIFSPPAKSLTPRNLEFVERYVANGGLASKAAQEAGYPKASAASAASRLLRNPAVQQEITKLTLQHIGLHAAGALKQVRDLSVTARSEYVRLEASKDILDRAGFRAPDRLDLRLDAALSVSFDIAPEPKIIEGGSENGE